VRKDKKEARLTGGMKPLLRSEFSGNASALRFASSRKLSGPGAFFQVVEAGFDGHAPTESLTNGLEIYREILGKNNEEVTSTHLGEQIHVRLHVRSLQREPITNVAIIDLLPGGFEVVDSLGAHRASSINGVDYVDVREDRAVFFVTAPTNALEIDYQIKSCNRGQFIVPPVFAQSMYDRKCERLRRRRKNYCHGMKAVRTILRPLLLLCAGIAAVWLALPNRRCLMGLRFLNAFGIAAANCSG